jgi:predicted small secreted protein
MNNLLVLLAFLIGVAIAFAIPVTVTKYFVKDTNLAIKIVLANFLVSVLVNKISESLIKN